MARPIVAPAPVVTEHTAGLRDLVDNQCQCRPFQHDLTGLMVLPHQSLANMARCILDSADNTHLSRFRSAAPWREDEVNRRRSRFMLPQTTPHRRRRRESRVVLDDTRCEHGGSLVDDVDRHDNHREGTSPLAHKPVTRLSVSGPVRFPLGLRLYRRDEELTPWETCVAKHVPAWPIPTAKHARHRLPQQVDPVWLQDPEFRARHEPFRPNIALAIAWVEEAIRGTGPFGVVVFDAWSLAADLVRVWARRRKDWIGLLNKNRGLETASLHVRDANGWALKLPGPPIAVAELVPLIPVQADRPVTVREPTYGSFPLGVRLPSLGQVRLVVSFANESLTGRDVVLVTNRVDWSAAKIMGLDLPRWPTETFDQDRQGHLGFNEDRMRSAEAMGNHWCLVFVASSLLHLTCLPAGPDRPQGLIHTLGAACRQQGRAWLQKLLRFVHDQ